jgi:CheY-like chemotaxis protein
MTASLAGDRPARPDDSGVTAVPARPPRILVMSEAMASPSHPDLVSLRDAGYHVQMAVNGIEALGRVIARRPDVVVLDLHPSKMQGLEVARRLKAAAATRPIPVIALVGRDGDAEDAARGAGCEAVLRKPCPPGRLNDEVQRHLQGRRPRPRRRGRCGRS